MAEHPSVTDCHFKALAGAKRTTSACLLALAQRHALVLRTLDQRLARGVVDGAAECLVGGQ